MSENRVVVITGASAGIGAALAELLAQQGSRVVLAARRQAPLDDLAARCGAGAFPIATDVTKRADVSRLVSGAIDRFGHIDVWVNNAGRGISRLPSELTDDDIDSMIQANVKSALYGMQEVLPHFKARGQGHIINISSMLGRVPFALPRTAYSGAKHFLNALTASFRLEVQTAHPGIQVSLVSPGVVATEFGSNALHGGMDSRGFPGAQTAAEVAAVCADVMVTRRPDVYTRPDGHATVMRYYGDGAVLHGAVALP